MNSPVTATVARRVAISSAPRDLMDYWPHDPYRFGDELAKAARDLIVPSSPLREDRAFVMDVMEAILAQARKQGVVFAPEVDVVVLDSGAAHVTDYREGWGRHWQSEEPGGSGS
jgi:hypothetical protein